MNVILTSRSEISSRDVKATKFIIKREATVDVELTSDHYRRTPLVQGGLEINATPRQATERYSALVEELHVEPKEE